MSTQSKESTVLPSSSPARWGSYASAAVGLVLLCGGLYALFVGAWPVPLCVSLAVVGGAQLFLTAPVLRLNRAAWGFMTAVAGTGAVVLFFVSPTIRDAFEVHLLVAMVPCALYGIICGLLIVDHELF